LKKKQDLELAAGTSAHYEDPGYYAATYVDRKDDVAFYVTRCASRGGSVLELGCGNGRITLPLARAGLDVVGVDLSKPMLADLRTRLRAEPEAVRARVQLRRGDMRKARTARRYRTVICPFNAFLHLYERVDVEQCLARVTEQLEPRGRFVFDVSIPEPEEMARDPERLHKVPPFDYPGVGRVRYGERFEYERLRQLLFVSMEFEPTDKTHAAFRTPLVHRQFFPRELEALLHYNGFAIEELVGDFTGPPTEKTATLAFVCKRR
jgi:SAM-dependent methyltransferase